MTSSSVNGKTVVITGATSGIGQVAAERLAEQGARIVQIARDRQRGEAALARLKAIRDVGHTIHYADLSTIDEMKRVAAEVAAAEPKIDVLINNAGAMFGSRQVTRDGLELTFATNHVAYYIVTLGLLKSLVPSARIVNTASDAHRGAKLDFADLQNERGYSGFGVYKKSKLANILFTRELARRLKGPTANSLHPGFVRTRFGDSSGGMIEWIIKAAKMLVAISQEKGAETIVYLASSTEAAGTTGEYFYKCKPSTPTAEAQDDASAKRLWEVTERLTGVTLSS
jgi:NAD(P)-dependent dehydrogenase (short-subunit alcohol dehydrogenase family)